MTTNRQVRLARRPDAGPLDRSIWEFTDAPADTPRDGELLVETLYASVDPAMRTWLNDVRSYVPPVAIGEVMRAYAVGRVAESRAGGFAAGDLVSGLLGMQRYATVPAAELAKLPPGDAGDLPMHLGPLGLSGLTAYFGLRDIGGAKPGDTVAISAAAGSVGSIAGQIAKAMGCRTIGIAGGAAKCRHLTDDLGFDAAVDYKADGLGRALRAACPAGLDVFFDNVGGVVLEAALRNLAHGARIVLCGAIAHDLDGPLGGPSSYMNLLVQRARMEGFVIFDFEDRYEEGRAAIRGWIADGAITPRYTILDGIDAFPEALAGLFAGANTGKTIVRLAAA